MTLIGCSADYRRDDFIFPRTRSDAAWRDLEKTKPLETLGARIVGVLLLGMSAAAFLYVAYQAAVMAGAISNSGVSL